MKKNTLSKLYIISDKWSDLITAAGLFLFLVLIIIPLLIIGHYNFPSVDDFSYAWEAGYTYGIDNGGIANVWTVIDNVINEWRYWQGTYFANYCAYLCNALFLDNYYFITPYITLLPMVGATLYTGLTILRKGFHASYAQSFIATVPVICLQVLYTYCPSEAYYWMCGATLYTIAYANAILTIGVASSLLLDRDNKKHILKKALFLCLSFVIGGSNYVSGLLTLGILFCITAYSFYTKNKNRILFCAQFILSVLFLLLSIFSPGATFRQSTVEDSLSASTAIFQSFAEAGIYINDWTILPVVLLVLSLIPIFVKILRGCSYRFPLPVVFSLLTFCIYAMEFTPCLYALGFIGANRIQNIYRHTLYILLPLNLFYWLGYLHRIGLLKRFTLPKRIPFLSPLYTGVAALILLPLLYHYGGSTITTVSAIQDLRSGIAQQYLEQYEERKALLTDDSIEDVVVKPLYDMPYLLYFGDLQSSPNAWENVSIARHFHKKSVRVASDN